jgi:predicted DNA-binding protein with PD1-like motif
MKTLKMFGLLFILLSAAGYGYGQTNKKPQSMRTQMEVVALRLRPGQDLKKEIMQWARTEKIKAGCVVTCVGSLQEVNLRFANQSEGTVRKGKYEIVSMVGTFSDEAAHIHLSVSDSTGATIGGHLMDGNLIYTTAEMVIGLLPDLEFARETDPTYGYKELMIKQKGRKP